MENKFYSSFLELLEKNEKEKSVNFIIDLLKEQKQSVKEIYINFLIPAMKHIRIERELGNITLWQERLLEGLLKTIIEQTIPFMLKEKSKSNHKKVLIASPFGEYEQLGAMVANNIFMLLGFDTYYLGAGLEENEILKAVENIKPHYYVIGLKNFYNAFETKELLDSITKIIPHIQIVVGGPVFKKEDVQHSLHYDYFVRDYTEIFELAKEVQSETSTKDSN